MKLEYKLDVKSLAKHLLDSDEDTVLTFMLSNKDWQITPLDGYSFDDSLYGEHIYDLKKVILKSDILKKNIRLNITNAALRTVDFKGGLDQFLKSAKKIKLSKKAQKLKSDIASKI